jgi:hypothetical protein
VTRGQSKGGASALFRRALAHGRGGLVCRLLASIDEWLEVRPADGGNPGHVNRRDTR